MSLISDGHAAEQNLAANLRRIRAEKRISQARLAQAMTDRGWAWHQQTVTKIEAGKQSLGHGEVTDVAAILGVSVDRLSWPAEEEAATTAVEDAAGTLGQRWHLLAEAVEGLLRARAGAGRQITLARETKYPRAIEAAAELESRLGEKTPDSAIARGVDRYEAPGKEDA